MLSLPCPVAVFFFGCLQRLPRHAGTQLEFPGIDTNTEYDGPAIKLLTDTDKERVLMAAKETGISTWEDIEELTTAVNLIDNNNSDDNDESETPSLMDPDFSDDKDSDNDDDDDADNDENISNYISVLENINSSRQEMISQDVNVNVTLGGRTQIISQASAGITSSAVGQLAWGHILANKGRWRTM